MYYLQLFGRVQLTDPQGVVIGGSKRLLQILVIACLSKRPRSTVEIANLLWPNVETKRRQQSFRQAMYKLNRAAPGIITVTNQRVLVDRRIITTDLDQIEDAEQRGDVDSLLGLIRGEFLPVAADGGAAHEQWVDAQYAEHWTPLVQRVRTHFQALAHAAEWQTAVEQYRRLRPPLADDVVILSVAIRSLIYSAESVTLRRDVTELIRHLRCLNRKQAERLSASLERRLRWDKRAKLHVGPFIGRTAELQAFTELHRSSDNTSGFLCCLSGPIGIGKSRTAKQFARIAAIRGSRVRRVSLALDQHNANYAKVARALQELVETRPVLRASNASPLLPAIAPSRLTSTPVLLVIDDLDWAGAACTQLLERLVVTLGDTASLGIVVTAKESSVVQRLVALAPHGSQAVHMRLQRFSGTARQHLMEWLRDRYNLSDEEVRQVDDYSGGVPAYAHRFAKRPQNTVHGAKLPGESVAEIRRLVPGALRLFALISFCGGRVHANALAAALETKREEVHRLATRLIDLGFIECKEDHLFETVDQCAADSIQREFELAELRQLGARVALATAASSRLDAARIANRIGDAELESRCYFASAREAIDYGAFSDAEVLLSKCSATAVNRRLSVRADFWQAEVHLRLRRYDEALTAYSTLLTTPHRLSPSMLIVAKARHAQVTSMKNPELASAAFDVTSKLPIRQLARKAPKAVAEVLLSSAAIGIVSGDGKLLAQIANRLEREIDRSTANPRWLELAATLCKLRLQIDGFAAVLPISDRYVRRARLSGVPAELASTLLTAAIVNTAACQLSAAKRLYDEVGEVVRNHRLLGFTHILASNFAVTLLEMGNIDEAISCLQVLREKDANIGIGYYLAFDHLNLATAFLEKGDFENANRHAREALARKAFFPNSEHATALAIQGIAAIHLGDVDAAAHLMREAETARQRWGDLSYSAILKALLLNVQVNGDSAIQHLLSAADVCDIYYRPAALRLRVFAAEVQAASNGKLAARIASRCARDAEGCGMQSVRSRAERVIQSSI